MPARGLRGFNPDERFGNGAKDGLQATEAPFRCSIRMPKTVKSDADITQRIRNVDNEVLLRGADCEVWHHARISDFIQRDSVLRRLRDLES
jgi:hypothetical protein